MVSFFEIRRPDSPRLFVRLWRFVFMYWPKESLRKRFEFRYECPPPQRRGPLAAHRETSEAYILHERCPECGHDLDTGWECNTCGFDAMPEALAIEERKNR